MELPEIKPPELNLDNLVSTKRDDGSLNILANFILGKEDLANGAKVENSFIHTGSIGDVWASLPCVREICRKAGKKAIYYLRPNVEATYYEGAVHPTVDDSGQQVGLNMKMIEMMIPLLKAQPYIEDARVHTNQKVRIPLNAIRYTFVNMPNHPLSYWYFYVFPDSFCDVSIPYIFVPKTEKDFAKGKLIVTRTERYQNEHINYKFLKAYEDKCVFAGTKLEHIIFNARHELNIPRLEINDFLELAQAVNQSVGTLTNQTMLAQISEGMKTHRAVELCKFAPNVTVQGQNGFEFYGQQAVEWWVSERFKK
jgi:hypothetical protein